MIDGLASRRTDAVVAVSEVLARQLEDTVVQGSCSVTVIPNGVDTELFRPRKDSGALRKELGLTPDQPIIGSIGRLEAIKGYEVMIGAFAQLKRQYPAGASPVLVVAGDGAERVRLEELTAQHGLEDSVQLTGLA